MEQRERERTGSDRQLEETDTRSLAGASTASRSAADRRKSRRLGQRRGQLEPLLLRLTTITTTLEAMNLTRARGVTPLQLIVLLRRPLHSTRSSSHHRSTTAAAFALKQTHTPDAAFSFSLKQASVAVAAAAAPLSEQLIDFQEGKPDADRKAPVITRIWGHFLR